MNKTSTENTSDPLSKKERDEAEKLLSQSIGLVEKENELINHRLNWGLLFQGLLFASVFIGGGSTQSFIVINSISELGHSTKIPESLPVINSSNWFIAAMGAISSLSIFLGTLFAHFVINREIELQAKIQELIKKPISGAKGYHWLLTYMAPHFALPAIGMTTWLMLAYQGRFSVWENQSLRCPASIVWGLSLLFLILAAIFIGIGRKSDKKTEAETLENLPSQLENYPKE